MQKNFIDFIVDVQKDKELARKFFGMDQPDQMKKFFADHGYGNISEADIDKLVDLNRGIEPDVVERFPEPFY